MSILGHLLQAVELILAGVLFTLAFLFALCARNLASDPPLYRMNNESTLVIVRLATQLFFWVALFLLGWALVFTPRM